ncbi:MAG: hypothetical protein IKA93_00970 [Elusimicrobiaceae bacterium]|nr:hypothetical protein [Elusimicrobiaceae bacterium]
MNKAYETMRSFWLDVKNLQHKNEVPQLGDQKICIAGVEMAARDTKGGVKNLMIAASSLGNASVYFENNSASGLGGFTGGAASGPVREKSLRLMQAAAKTAGQMDKVTHLLPQANPENVTLFVVSGEGQLYAKELNEKDARNPEQIFYPFFAYSQQVLGAFRQEQEKAAQSAAAGKEATEQKKEKTSQTDTPNTQK